MSAQPIVAGISQVLTDDKGRTYFVKITAENPGRLVRELWESMSLARVVATESSLTACDSRAARTQAAVKEKMLSVDEKLAEGGQGAIACSQAAHTPGPWKSVERSTPRVTMLKVYAGKKVIADLVAHPDDLEYQRKTPAEQRANARLIAAAPDLLAACFEVCEGIGKTHPQHAGMETCHLCQMMIRLRDATLRVIKAED